MEAEETQPKLSKKLQYVTLCPLLSGILICTLIIISILFGSYLSWMSSTTSYIEQQENNNLIRLSKSCADIVGANLKQVKTT
jgi:hypothetical protein